MGWEQERRGSGLRVLPSVVCFLFFVFVLRNGSEGSRSGEGLVRGHTGPRGERIGQVQVQGNWQSGGIPGIGSSPSGWGGEEGRVCMRVKVAPESQAVTVSPSWPVATWMDKDETG